MSSRRAVLNPEDGINKHVAEAQYAVRGKLYLEATKRKAEGKPVTFTNIGNPQALLQKPISFPRQVLSLMTNPVLLDHPDVAKLYPADAIARARQYLAHMPGGTGAYQDSRGNAFLRQEVADFIKRRDGYPAEADTIFLSDGASTAIQRCLNLTIRSEDDVILLPIPQYPLYSATVTLLGGTQVGYYLQEDKGWALDIQELQKTVDDVVKSGKTCRAIVIINPGNPTGQVLSEENIKDILLFAKANNIVVFADEVYQVNIYGETPFVSFKKVLGDLGDEGTDIELLSFHSTSKGVFGECGRRGGYVEAVNIHTDAVQSLYKLFSIGLCANVDGQITTAIMCNPPKKGDASYETFTKECDDIFQSLKRRAAKLSKALDGLDGIECNPVEGAMYAFPNIKLPPGAITAAKEEGESPDQFYCLRLLHATGMCVVPGSGFGQKDDTYHFRTTILPQEDVFDRVIESFADFHKSFMEEFTTHSRL